MYPDPFLFTVSRCISFKWEKECFLLVKGEWSISQSVKFYCILSEWIIGMDGTMYLKRYQRCIRCVELLQRKCISFLGISLFVLDMPCVLNTHTIMFKWYFHFKWHFIGSISWCLKSLLFKHFIDQYEWQTRESSKKREKYFGSRGVPQKAKSFNVLVSELLSLETTTTRSVL